MILKLNPDSTITIKEQSVPENIKNVHISYIFEKGTNHYMPFLYYAGNVYEGKEIFVPFNIDLLKPEGNTLHVILKDNNGNIFKRYKTLLKAEVYIAANITKKYPDLVKYIEALERENKELKEKGDII